MISIKEALDIIKKNKLSPRQAKLPLDDILGLRLEEDIFAPEPAPRFTNSAMDGFAVNWKDIESVQQAGPVMLPIAGESRAGIPFKGCCPHGHIIKINTGAMLADGTDTVVRVEDTEVIEDKIKILKARKKGQDVRYAGEEFKIGDLLLSKGIQLQAPHLALLYAVGIGEALVTIPPKVAVIATGSELVKLGQEIKNYQIRDSNSIMLKAAVKQSGGELTQIRNSIDDLETITATISQVAPSVDIILVTGGVSVGEHDHVKAAAKKCGFEDLFWKVKQKPGKPLYLAAKDHCLLFGLPGNPVSGFMCFMYYIQPIIREWQGQEFSWQKVKAKLKEEVNNQGKRTNFLRVSLAGNDADSYIVEVFKKQGSHMLTSISMAAGFIILEPEALFNKGDELDVYLFPWSK